VWAKKKNACNRQIHAEKIVALGTFPKHIFLNEETTHVLTDGYKAEKPVCKLSHKVIYIPIVMTYNTARR
jgi:hypothetical protein